MSRRRKNANRSKPPSQRRRFHWPAFDLGSIRRSLIALSWLGVIIALVGGWIFGVPKLQAFASVNQRSDELTVEFLDAPPWVTGRVHDMLLRTAHLHLGDDPLAREDLVVTRAALLETGWFESIDQVRRTSPDRLEVHGRFVRPYAIIRDDAGDHLVDYTGRVLPKKYRATDRTHFVVISGAYFPRPEIGEKWEGADISAALRLTGLIYSRQWRDQVARIDVVDYVTGQPIRIITDRGKTIIWGQAPGEESALEVLAEGKLARLDFLHVHHRRIEGSYQGNVELDITNQKAVVTREIVAE